MEIKRRRKCGLVKYVGVDVRQVDCVQCVIQQVTMMTSKLNNVYINTENELLISFKDAIRNNMNAIHTSNDCDYIGTYYVWADDTYCLNTEVSEYSWKSDDFHIIEVKGM